MRPEQHSTRLDLWMYQTGSRLGRSVWLKFLSNIYLWILLKWNLLRIKWGQTRSEIQIHKRSSSWHSPENECERDPFYADNINFIEQHLLIRPWSDITIKETSVCNIISVHDAYRTKWQGIFSVKDNNYHVIVRKHKAALGKNSPGGI